MSQSFHNGRVILHAGDCINVLDDMDANSVDAVCCDPPYHLLSTIKRFSATSLDGEGTNEKRARAGTDGYARLSKGFMGKAWDGGDIAFRPETWAKVLRVLKPGGHLVAFAAPKCSHRMVCAIEDAGFEIRDQIMYLFGSGFPKSLNVSKAIDKAAGKLETQSVGFNVAGKSSGLGTIQRPELRSDHPEYKLYEHATDDARKWEGWGTALKPAFENICLAQKPLQNNENIAIIGSKLREIWSALWSTLPAKDAEQFSMLSPRDCSGEEFGFAQWNAERRSNTRGALSDQMDMSLFETATISSLSTVASWNGIWAESSKRANTSIIETELSTIMTLKTLRFLVSKITPVSIILAHRTGQWSIANASHAERSFNAIALKLSAILELSALANAIDLEAENCRVAGVSPAYEPICLACKPLGEATVAANVLKHGTGAINVDACRVEADDQEALDRNWDRETITDIRGGNLMNGKPGGLPNTRRRHGGGIPGNGTSFELPDGKHELPSGRWPANICHDGSEEVLAGFPDTTSGILAEHHQRSQEKQVNVFGAWKGEGVGSTFENAPTYGDSGSAARFFYSAKAGPDDRLASKHPTVKPIALMRWLVRMITPPGGTVLDCFAGTGSTGHAALLEGFKSILIEREAEYRADIERRMSLVFAGEHETTMATKKQDDHSTLPLFGGMDDAGGGESSQIQRAQVQVLRRTSRTIGPIGMKR